MPMKRSRISSGISRERSPVFSTAPGGALDFRTDASTCFPDLPSFDPLVSPRLAARECSTAFSAAEWSSRNGVSDFLRRLGSDDGPVGGLSVFRAINALPARYQRGRAALR